MYLRGKHASLYFLPLSPSSPSFCCVNLVTHLFLYFVVFSHYKKLNKRLPLTNEEDDKASSIWWDSGIPTWDHTHNKHVPLVWWNNIMMENVLNNNVPSNVTYTSRIVGYMRCITYVPESQSNWKFSLAFYLLGLSYF